MRQRIVGRPGPAEVELFEVDKGTFDRLLALRFGSAAVRAIGDGEFGCCVVYTPPTVGRVPLVEIIGKPKLVPLDSGIIMTARNLGISLGD